MKLSRPFKCSMAYCIIHVAGIDGYNVICLAFLLTKNISVKLCLWSVPGLHNPFYWYAIFNTGIDLALLLA